MVVCSDVFFPASLFCFVAVNSLVHTLPIKLFFFCFVFHGGFVGRKFGTRGFYSFGEFYDRARCVFFHPTEILSMKKVFLLARGGFFGVPPKKKPFCRDG